MPPVVEPTLELSEFQSTSERDINPYTTFVNHFFVYPIGLSFDSQKVFSRARNITVIIELRETDGDDSKALKVKISSLTYHTYLLCINSLFFFCSAFMDDRDKICLFLK